MGLCARAHTHTHTHTRCVMWDACLLVSPPVCEHLEGRNGAVFTLIAWHLVGHRVQLSSVQSLSCVRLCDPMNRSTPGLPVHHQLPEFTQSRVHRVSDAIQPSHPWSSPSPPAPPKHLLLKAYVISLPEGRSPSSNSELLHCPSTSTLQCLVKTEP